METIGFLHTSSVHVATFDALVAELAPGAAVVNVVDESLLDRARTLGTDHPTVVGGVRAAVVALAGAGATTIVCTCSTIGGLAESIGVEGSDIRVVRVDRAMAGHAIETAAAGGGRILVLAALDSTIGPTRDLIESVAHDRGAAVVIDCTVVEDAWTLFDAGDRDGYLDAIAVALAERADRFDVVVLAQASMAPAADRAAVGVPVLSSPRLAISAL
jgi:hypothetical protein